MIAFSISVSSWYVYPVEIICGSLVIDDNNKRTIDIPQKHPLQGEWSSPELVEIDISQLRKLTLELSYISIVESKIYYIEKDISLVIIEKSNWTSYSQNRSNIVVGIVPFGGVAIWLKRRSKSILMDWTTAVVSNDKTQIRKDLLIDEICKKCVRDDIIVKKNLIENGVPPRNLFNNYMKQFAYRYQVRFGHWNEEKIEWRKYDVEEVNLMPEFDYIEETLFDGTHDKLQDGGLMNYHQAGKPKKLAVKWHIKKSEYTAYFWFEDEEIRAIFDRFYGTHPETKTDFMIRIDAEKNKYELALYRYGLKEPKIVSESAYQLIVFKNKFEYFRSENYNQPKGAWIW